MHIKQSPYQYYHKLFLHIVFGTKNKEPYISSEIEPRLFAHFQEKAKENQINLLEYNGTEDHVHFLVKVLPTHYIPDVIKLFKGSSSHFINNKLPGDNVLYWQRGYGVLSLSEKSVPNVTRYIRKQKRHHEEKRLFAALEKY